MAKSALGVLFSLLFIVFLADTAIARETAATKTTKKHAAKKTAVVARHVKPAAGKQRALATKSGSRKHHVVAAHDEDKKAPMRVVRIRGRHKAGYQRVSYSPAASALPPVMTAGDLAGLNQTRDSLDLRSNAAVVMDQNTSEVLFEKNSQVSLPIASITKLMTSVIVLEAQQNMDEVLTVTDDDLDREKFTHSRLRIGSQLTRANMLHIALMSSENRAASALGRNYPGGLPAFVAAMNAKAKALGMVGTHYVDSTGLSSQNVSTARDLAKLVAAAYHHPLIREYSTNDKYAVEPGGPTLQYRNSNHLVLNPSWEIGLQKTGYISEAGHCLVMQANIDGRPVVMVFLDSKGKDTRLADAARVRKWLETSKPSTITATVAKQS